MENVIYMSNEGVSTISLNRPEKYNALDGQTLTELLGIIKEVKENDDKIVILTGEGPAFCAGGDINAMTEFASSESFNESMDLIAELTMELYMLPKLLITAVNGSVAGLGLSLALNSDYIIAEEEAEFSMLFAGIGLVPDGGGHFHLEERLGTHKAKQFIWGMEKIKGEKVKEMGLADIITSKRAVMEANQLTNTLKHAPLLAMIESKLLLHNSKKDKLAAYLEAEKHSQGKMFQTEDHKEGVRAFLSKERPAFKSK